MSTLDRAIEIAARAHAGQVDLAGAPYILHPLRVMLAVRTSHQRMAAVLHDLVEDTDWTLDRLRSEGFPPDVVAAVDALTRRTDESYDDLIQRAAADSIARVVKLADLADNMDPSRIATPTDRDRRRLERYRRAARILELAAAPAPPPD
jgi:(p)ppGpp synthase/HD superfamily hydrolase